jgi:hypothetical protein
MKAELSSNDFTITAITPAAQMLRAEGYRSWLWDLQPKESGDLSLWLTVSVLYGGEMLDNKVFERKIRVQVNQAYSVKSFVGRNWDKLLAASGLTVAGIVGGLFALIRRRTRDETTRERDA